MLIIKRLEVMRRMGDKIAARQAAIDAGVQVLGYFVDSLIT
jgi:biotin carboxylase